MAAAVFAPARQLAHQAGLVVVAAYAVVAVVAVERSVPGFTSYAGASDAAHVIDLAAGLTLLTAGILAYLQAGTRRLGVLTLLLGAAWFVPDFEGWDQGPVLVRSLASAAALLFPALLFHFASAAPRGRATSRLAATAVGCVYAVSIGIGVGRALVRDPFADTTCWRSCLDNSLLVHADGAAARAFEDAMTSFGLVLGVAVAGVAAWRLVRAGATGRRALAPPLVPCVAAGGVYAAHATALLVAPLEDPSRADFSSIFLAGAAALVAIGAGVGWLVVLAHRTRVALARLTAELREAPQAGALEKALRAAVGDSTLRVVYPLRNGRLVDADGKARAVAAEDAGRAVTPITRAGHTIALVLHDADAVDASFAGEIGSAARLAIENERLRAELLAQVEDLRASRARIVEAGDAGRRRLERDLHDGAQQHLLALSFDLRAAKRATDATGEREVAALLADVEDEARAALAELRELAHGIFPAILAEAGLEPALASLRDTAPLPVLFKDVTRTRHAASVEMAAYVCVADAVADAAARHASFASVAVRGEDGRLVVSVDDDGAVRADSLAHLADRVGALRGSIEIGGTAVRAEIPCA